ncbi:type II secretion system protein [Pseudomethylobacillus aquaticus]|uniref:Type II secretion system protein n=1 Tax=Pseudomethylobacillus aquaticus TaxID=2676064 RepID=A0A3N0UZV9_9PROT|nr:type II secretion system protein [Pseudomethylobacillus aquaticus]ROH85778.1 type II secretion system protein [Pseudomethylobacillus aquaticus]
MSTCTHKPQHAVQEGFSLVEMAMVLAMVGLLLGSMSTPLSAMRDQAHQRQTRQQLSEAHDALIGYAISHGHLPCPAISALDGSEDRDPGTLGCNKRIGLLPWSALGISGLDSWQHRLGYSVTAAYADAANRIHIGSLANRDITLRTRNPSGTLVNLSNSNNIPAVVVSHGARAGGAWNADGSKVADSSTSNSDEAVNSDGDGRVYIYRVASDNPDQPGGEFDDLLVWLSPHLYLSRVLAAGQLP